MVAEHGGVVHTGTTKHTMRGIQEMIQLLKEGTIKGFLVDRNTYYHFSNRISEKKYRQLGKNFTQLHPTYTEKLTKQKLVCGFLLRDLEVFNFYKAFFDNNRLHITSCNAVRINTRDAMGHSANNPKGFGVDGPVLRKVVCYGFVIVVVVVIVVVCCEEARRRFVGTRDASRDAGGGGEKKSLVV